METATRAISSHPDASDSGILSGAHDQTRTDDPFLTMEVLYQLSYAGSRAVKMERETGFEPATLSLEG